MANSASRGSISQLVDLSMPVEERAAILASKVQNVNLSAKTARQLVLFKEKFGTGNSGYRELLDSLYDLYPHVWERLVFTFRFEWPATLTRVLNSLQLDQRCKICQEFTTRKHVCVRCTLKDPVLAHRTRFTASTDKSQRTIQASGGHGEAVKKRRATSLRVYGTTHPSKNEAVKEKTAKSWESVDKAAVLQKTRETNLLRYGTEFPMQNPEVAKKTAHGLREKLRTDGSDIVARRKATYKSRTGYESPRQNPEIVQRSAATMKRKTGYDHNMRDPAHLLQREEEHLKKYGVRHSNQRPEVKARIVRTSMERHGGLGLQSQTIRARVHETNLRKYGTEVPTSNPFIMAKCKATWLKKYGFTNPNQNPEQKMKGLKSSFRRVDVVIGARTFTVQGRSEVQVLHALVERYGADRVLTQFDDEYPRELSWTPDFYVRGRGYYECKSIWTLVMPNAVERNREKGRDNVTWLVTYLRSIIRLPRDWYEFPNLDGLMNELYFRNKNETDYSRPYVEKIEEWLSGDRTSGNTVFNNQRKIAVTFVPLFWQDIESMQARKRRAEARGWRLIFMYEHVLRLRAGASRSFLMNLAGNNPDRAGARECVFEERPIGEVRAFFNQNHVQGAPSSGRALCLSKNGRLRAVAVFNNHVSSRGSGRTSLQGRYELTRYASEGNVPGGMSRLLKKFVADAHPSSIVSYSDSNLFSGASYAQLGFVKTGESASDYLAWNGGLHVQGKQVYMKSNLQKNWPLVREDLTEQIGRASCRERVLMSV